MSGVIVFFIPHSSFLISDFSYVTELFNVFKPSYIKKKKTFKRFHF